MAAALLMAASATGTSSDVVPVRTGEIAPGVFAAISLDPLGLANHSNAVFIVNDDDAILVDTQFTLERTRKVLRTCLGLTDNPVSLLINTHWHDDHTFGNQVIVDAFSGAEIVAHAMTKKDMAGIGVTNRTQQVAGGEDALAMFRDCLDKKTSLDGTPMGSDEQQAYQSTIDIVEQYLVEQSEFRLTLPTKTFDDRMVLKRGTRTIEIRHVGPAVTAGDAVVYLPGEGVLIAGDVVDNPLPFAYRCHVSGWIAALDSIRELNPRVIVPGHGEVLQGTAHVERLAALLRSIREQTRAAVARGETLDAARKSVSVDELRDAIVGENKMLTFLFDGYFLGPVIASAYEEATKE